VTRPHRLVVVTGTGTEVGKTWWTARLCERLGAAGVSVAARKPAQSFEPGAGPTDADVLAAATADAPESVCPADRWYPVPMAPPMAAAALGRPSFTIRALAAEITWPAATDVGLVEGAGGPRSPLAADGDTVDLASALGADTVVLVGDPGLGTINAVRLAAAPFGATPLVVALNRFDPADDLHVRNGEWLAGDGGFDLVTDPADLARRWTS